MKRMLVAVSAVMAMLCSLTVMANGIAVVDMLKVIQSAPQVKQMRSKLQKQFAGQRKELDKQEKAFQADMQKLQRNKATMSKAQVTAFQKKLASENNKLRSEQAKFQQALITAQNKAMNSFMKKVQAIAAKIANKKGLDIVVAKNTVIYIKPGMDVTPDVLAGLK